MSEEKLEFIERSKTFWNPAKTQAWQELGVDLVIDRREGYFLYDMDGRRLIDVHLNGGTFNLGHRHPELVAVMTAATQRFDMGNHHFPSLARTALAFPSNGREHPLSVTHAVLLSMMIVGRVGRAWGPLLGAAALMIVDEVLRQFIEWRLLGLGLMLILFVVLWPNGLAGAIEALARRVARSLPHPIGGLPARPGRCSREQHTTPAITCRRPL